MFLQSEFGYLKYLGVTATKNISEQMQGHTEDRPPKQYTFVGNSLNCLHGTTLYVGTPFVQY